MDSGPLSQFYIVKLFVKRCILVQKNCKISVKVAKNDFHNPSFLILFTEEYKQLQPSYY